MEMQCNPHCPYFQDSPCTNWVLDEKYPFIKRRVTPANFKCTYDGHVITNWYSPCPKLLEETIKNMEENNNDYY